MKTSATVFVLVALGAVVSLADQWAPPVEKDYVSSNGRFVAHVTPAGATAKALLQVYELQDGRRVPFWDCTLGNEGAPEKVFLTDDGRHAVSVNEWNARRYGGWGDYVLAFYHEKGELQHYSLEQLLGYPERISQQEFNRLVMVTTAGRQWAIILFLRQIDGRELFFAWLDRGRCWLAWDVVAGSAVEVTLSLSSRFDEVAREWAVQELQKPERRPPGYDWLRAMGILQRLKKPEDRGLMEPLLRGDDFYTEHALNSRTFKYYYAYSFKRNSAEKAMAVWDGRVTGSGGILDEYRYLGVVHGTLVLPRAPTSADKSWLCVYLIPESGGREDWYSEVPVHRLCVYFGPYPVPARDVWPGPSIPFVIGGISPGRYHVKAVWDTSSPNTFSSSRISGPPSPGDYENRQAPLIDVAAGGVIKGVTIDCTQEVGQHPVTVWSSEVLRPAPAEDAPCPCGKEHGRNRVCMVFNKPLAFTRFNWGPYHNCVPTTVSREGTTTTYEYVFEKAGPDPNQTARQAFDMCVRMVAIDNELSYVTVEGPYFFVMRFEFFLHALMVGGLDTRNPEGQMRIYGGPIRYTTRELSVQQIIETLGQPSEVQGDEILFNYSLRCEGNRNPPKWVRYKTTQDGLVLEGKTNLAGGITSFRSAW